MKQRFFRLPVPQLNARAWVPTNVVATRTAQGIVHGQVSAIYGHVNFPASQRLFDLEWLAVPIEKFLFGEPNRRIKANGKHTSRAWRRESPGIPRRQLAGFDFFARLRIDDEAVALGSTLARDLKKSAVGGEIGVPDRRSRVALKSDSACLQVVNTDLAVFADDHSPTVHRLTMRPGRRRADMAVTTFQSQNGFARHEVSQAKDAIGIDRQDSGIGLGISIQQRLALRQVLGCSARSIRAVALSHTITLFLSWVMR